MGTIQGLPVRNSRWLLGLWWLLLWTPWILATGAVFAREPASTVVAQTHYFLEDSRLADARGGRSLLNALEQGDWQPFDGVLTLGYGPKPFWIRVTILSEPKFEPLVLRMRPSVLDDVQVHQVQGDGSLRVSNLGDRQLVDSDARFDTAIAVNLAARQELGGHEAQPRVLYIRVQSTSARMARVVVDTLSQVERRRDFEHTSFGIYFGLMVALLLWALSHALNDRDTVFAWYAAYQAVAVAMNFGLMGYARLALPPYLSPDLWTSAFVLGISLLGPLFHWSLLASVMRPYPLPRAIAWPLAMTLAVVLANLFQAFTGRLGPALELNAAVVALASLLISVVVTLQVWRRPNLPLRRLLVGYALHCVVIVVSLLPLLGLLEGGDWALFSTSIHGLLLALVLAGMLAIRRAQLLLQAQEDRTALVVEQSRVRQAESERDEKDRFISMITHELRTPLSVIRMVLEGARRREPSPAAHRQLDLARGAVTDIDQVIERTLMVDRLERQSIALKVGSFELSEMVRLCTDAQEQAQRVVRTGVQSPVWVHSDAVLLRVIVSNLLDNALKYSAADSPVEVRIEEDSRQVRLLVKNRPGRAGRPDPSRVFRKYYRSEGAKHHSGSGQGLFLVDGLAHRLGIQLTCRPGQDGQPVCFELSWEQLRHDGTVDPDPGRP